MSALDSWAYARRLESVGFSPAQARALAEEQAKLINERLVTKEDIIVLRSDLESGLPKRRLLEPVRLLVLTIGLQTAVLIIAMLALAPLLR